MSISNHSINSASRSILNYMDQNDNEMTSSMQKLSSGLRVNSAADDPADYTISEGMKAQIGTLSQSQQNGQNAISLLQVADGALGNIEQILTRIRTLVAQRNNGTLNDTDKGDINTEIYQLIDEMNAIGENTKFNGIKLLDGSFKNKDMYVGASYPISLDDMTSLLSFSDNFNRPDGSPGSDWPPLTGNWSIQNGQLVQSQTGIGDKDTLAEGPQSNDSQTSVSSQFLNSDPRGNIGIVIKGSDINNMVFGWYNQSGALYIGERVNGVFKGLDGVGVNSPSINTTYNLSASVEGSTYTFSVDGVGTVQATSNDLPSAGYSGVFTAFSSASFSNFKATPEPNLDSIDNAIQTVTNERVKVGTDINQMNASINNVSQYNMNLTNAQSTITDANMAQELTQFTSEQVRGQVSQAILAQANKEFVQSKLSIFA